MQRKSQKKRIKRYFLLLEVAIAIALSAILFTVLFQFLVSNTKFEQKTKKVVALLSERQRVENRLDWILGNIELPLLKHPNFYTEKLPDDKELSLAILFNAGIDPDPAFSGPTVARLHVNEKKEFCFSWWPLTKKGYRTEVLLSNIHHVEWEFLGHKEDKDRTIVPIAGKWAWLKEWPQNKSGLPSIIRLKLWSGIDKKKQREPNLQFAFILPNQEAIECVE
jgi:type II secretory pathway pseudopilin PulG